MASHLPICTACGSQYDAAPGGGIPFNCKICDDPRQFVPPAGQQWTTLETLRQDSNRSNRWETSPYNPKIWSIWTEPKIRDLGGLEAVVISHPHFYTTYVDWATVFDCPVYVSELDREWICQEAPEANMVKFIRGASEPILPGVTAITAGGHFPGSLVLHWDDQLFIADTIQTIPAAHTPEPRPLGQTSFTFQWSIPNMIPLDPDTIFGIWESIRSYDFRTTYGAFNGMPVRDDRVKERILESMKTQVRHMGWKEHHLLNEQV
ncbi:MAG: hypothetical protein Q9196_003399 [Gyalolechia fulgens]